MIKHCPIKLHYRLLVNELITTLSLSLFRLQRIPILYIVFILLSDLYDTLMFASNHDLYIIIIWAPKSKALTGQLSFHYIYIKLWWSTIMNKQNNISKSIYSCRHIEKYKFEVTHNQPSKELIFPDRILYYIILLYEKWKREISGKVQSTLTESLYIYLNDNSIVLLLKSEFY